MASTQSGSGQTAPALPPYLLSSWRLDPLDETNNSHQIRDFTTSSISKAFIETQLSLYDAAQRKREIKNTSSLSSLAASKVLQLLFASDVQPRDATTIFESLGPANLKRLLNDPSLTYPQFRRLYGHLKNHSFLDCEKEVDIDQVVLRNEKYIRSRGKNANRDGHYLINLQQLLEILPEAGLSDRGCPIVHAAPPLGGLEMFKLDPDPDPNFATKIRGTEDSVAMNFQRLTKGVFQGMDWNNVIVAGGMAFLTLMHTPPVSDEFSRVVDPAIDVYLFGLGPDEANAKIEHIHNVWVRNTSSMTDRTVVKDPRTITFLTRYPNRRIQIILKLVPSPTDMLLNVDLDACALGYDGSQILMLPRFVRALESGSSMFTMDLIWGHRSRNRGATQKSRLCKYAQRGFGVRLPPSYARSLEITLPSRAEAEFGQKDGAKPHSAEDSKLVSVRTFEQRDRFPQGKECGLKTLKRVAFLGRDFAHRFVYGVSPLLIPPQVAKTQNAGEHDSESPQRLLDRWNEKIEEAAQNRRRRVHTRRRPSIDLDDIDGDSDECYEPDIKCGLGNFEKFVRYSEFWRMDANKELCSTVDHTSEYTRGESYDSPLYDWTDTFKAHVYKARIDHANLDNWSAVKAAICEKVGIFRRDGGFNGYASRMLRRRVHGTDIRSVASKQLTIPVIIPPDLEYYILNVLPSRYLDLPASFTSSPCLIPLQNQASLPSIASIPNLRQIATEDGNLRWWVITNASMWEGQHPVVDEVFELLWSLHHWLIQESSINKLGGSVSTARPECVQHVARAFRRRYVLPNVDDEDEFGPDLPSLRETMLFRAWALRSPPNAERSHFGGDEDETCAHELFDGDKVRYPFEDELFWKGDKEEMETPQTEGKESYAQHEEYEEYEGPE